MELIKFSAIIMHLLCSDWFTKSRLSAHIPLFYLIWKTIVPGVAFSAGSESFFGKMEKKKKRKNYQTMPS